MRLFLALNLPERLRRDIWQVTADARDAGPSIKWIAESRIHVTLKFIGEQPESALPSLIDAIRIVGGSHSAPHVEISGLGAFPTFHRPRIIWIGVEPDPRLELLHHDVEIACEKLGYEVEGRPFRPHLTLGRVGEPLHADERRALRSAGRAVRFTGTFQPTTIDMMQSTTGSSGAPYATLASAPMRTDT
jgi:RNA 2',3'-cyclic 3'-phosphodiesterase